MKKLFIIILSVVFFSVQGYTAIIWFSASYLVPSPTTGSAPGPSDGTQDFSVISGTCVLNSDASINDLSTSSTNTLNLTNSMTLTVNGNISNASGCTISIASGVTLIVVGTINNQGVITIAAGGNLVQTGTGSNSGVGTYNITANGHGSVNQYNLWSSPISSASLAGVFSGANQCDIYFFNASTQVWTRDIGTSTCTPVAPTSGDGNMNIGRGYVLAGGGATTFSSSTVNNNTHTVSVSNNGIVSPDWTGTDWNLIGNPYPSSISAATFLTNNAARINGTVYFWDDDNSAGSGYDGGTDFSTWNLAGGSGSGSSGGGSGVVPNGSIAVGQGFFVQAHSTGTVSFTNSMRGGSNAQFFKTDEEEINRIWLNARNSENKTNQILIAFSDSATNGEDWGYDSKRLATNSQFSFGTLLQQQTESYVIQSFPKSSLEITKEVPISLSSSDAGVVSIEIANTENFDSNVVVYLKDFKTGKIQDLSTGPFSVYLKANQTYNSRFTLVFKKESGSGPNGVKSIDNAYIGVYSYNNVLYLTSTENSMTNLELINMTGSVVSNTSLKNTHTIQIDLNNLAPGMYIARVITDNNLIKSKRFLVK